jgi:hypothetical protein
MVRPLELKCSERRPITLVATISRRTNSIKEAFLSGKPKFPIDKLGNGKPHSLEYGITTKEAQISLLPTTKEAFYRRRPPNSLPNSMQN